MIDRPNRLPLAALLLGLLGLLGVAACAAPSGAGSGVRDVNAAAARDGAAPGAPPGGDAQAQADAATSAAVRGAVEGMIAAENVGNPDLVTGFLASDAVLLPPQAAPIAGVNDIRNHYLSEFERGTFTLTARSDETLVSGDLAVDRGLLQGSLQPKGGGRPVAQHDQYLMVLRRDATGRWRILRLMWSPAAPAP